VGQVSLLREGVVNKSVPPGTGAMSMGKGQSSGRRARNMKEFFANQHWKQDNFYYHLEPKDFSRPP
jgi:hypothetical protein